MWAIVDGLATALLILMELGAIMITIAAIVSVVHFLWDTLK